MLKFMNKYKKVIIRTLAIILALILILSLLVAVFPAW